ncbi:hypothetical protein [Mucilaginibacter sp. OK098]|nr:hypothetical protein [Mucilaginibacter sp. OK098]SHN10713.1 hypothetical protein SAMN05216524_105255 [Mucilaginibacter sp. OK098]
MDKIKRILKVINIDPELISVVYISRIVSPVSPPTNNTDDTRNTV